MLVQWYGGVYHVRGVWYNGMDVRTMLGELCYIGTLGRMFVPFKGTFGTMVWRFAPC